jgi:hypothetical protein
MFRHGQWVKFDLELAGAHVTPDGKTLGIYQAAREPTRVDVVSDEDDPSATLAMAAAMAAPVPEHVAVVRPDGTNLMRLGDDGQSLVKVACAPGDCPGLEAATVPDDLPRCDRTADLFPAKAGGKAKAK